MSTSPAAALSAHLGGRWTAAPLGASSFTATWCADGPGARLFVKTLPAAQAPVLEAEADGLAALAATGTVRVPAVVGCWCDDAGMALLAIEWLALAPAGDRSFGERLGQALAALHLAPPAEGGGCFGWRRDNHLGATPQGNRWSAQGGLEGWLAFFGDQRLRALNERLRRASASMPLTDAVDAVIAALPRFFDDGHVPRPSLIHGDLWSGNWAGLATGQGVQPVLYDPAVSVSDAEAELAMMEMFGAPAPGFWAAYREAAGLAPGYRRRCALYQLYHLLNHALLFGGGYVRQALGSAQMLSAAR